MRRQEQNTQSPSDLVGPVELAPVLLGHIWQTQDMLAAAHRWWGRPSARRGFEEARDGICTARRGCEDGSVVPTLNQFEQGDEVRSLRRL